MTVKSIVKSIVQPIVHSIHKQSTFTGGDIDDFWNDGVWGGPSGANIFQFNSWGNED